MNIARGQFGRKMIQLQMGAFSDGPKHTRILLGERLGRCFDRGEKGFVAVNVSSLCLRSIVPWRRRRYGLFQL